MANALGLPSTAFLSRVETYVDAAIENEGSSNAVLSQETLESDAHWKLHAREREKISAGQVRAVQAVLKTQAAADIASRAKSQQDLIAQIDRQAQALQIEQDENDKKDREDHQRRMIESRPAVNISQAQTTFEAVATASELAPLTSSLTRLTRTLKDQSTLDQGAESIAELEAAIQDPVARFVLMQLARATLANEGFDAQAMQLDQAIEDAYRLHGVQIRAVSNIAVSAGNMFKAHEQRSRFHRFYLQTLNVRLTPRYVFEGLRDVAGTGNFNRSAQIMIDALSEDMRSLRSSIPRDQLARLYSYLKLFHRAQVARSMFANAKQLAEVLRLAGRRGESKPPANALDLCGELLSLGHASRPGVRIDKLIERVGDGSPGMRSKILHFLYRQLSSWPEQVWVNRDTRVAVQKQLLDRLDQAFESQRNKMIYAVGVGDRYFSGGAI